MWIQTSQQRRARRTATRGIMELSKTDAALRKLVDVRRGKLAAITTEVGKAHVVNENDDDVGSLFGSVNAEWNDYKRCTGNKKSKELTR
jgi:hypothetical protein